MQVDQNNDEREGGSEVAPVGNHNASRSKNWRAVGRSSADRQQQRNRSKNMTSEGEERRQSITMQIIYFKLELSGTAFPAGFVVEEPGSVILLLQIFIVIVIIPLSVKYFYL
jgi:hypothetical protein